MKKIVCTQQVILVDGEASVTNHPNSELLLPDDEADVLIAEGKAVLWVDPTAAPDTPVATATPPAESSSAGSGFGNFDRGVE